ncbi:MAG: TetR family transcriptional regulator, partial [Hydrogenophaga sp.]
METQRHSRRRTTGQPAKPAPRTTRASANHDAAERPDRRQAILLAAERLFSLRGYHGVSIRQIAEEAGVPLALVGYYFGPKQALFHAIFESWSDTIDSRMALLRAAEREPWDEGKLQRIVQAFVGPVIQMRASPEGEYYALLMTQGLSTQQDEAAAVLREFFDPMAEAFIGVLHDTLAHEAPGITRGTVAWCYQFALGTLLHHIADIRVEKLSGGVNQPNDPRAAPLLIDFIVHGIRGAVRRIHPPPPRRKPPQKRQTQPPPPPLPPPPRPPAPP